MTLRAPVVVGMAKLLKDRKATLEETVRERFRQAREDGTAADVKMLSATLRALKRKLAAVDQQHPSGTTENNSQKETRP